MIFSSDQIPQTQDAGNLHLYVNDTQMYQRRIVYHLNAINQPTLIQL